MTNAQTGSCQCGGVRFSLAAEPLATYACFCADCQKRTGSAFSLGMLVPLEALQVRGELSEFTRVSDTGQRNTRYSCASCGNIIYGVGDSAPVLAKLQPGTLDDTSGVQPEILIWTRSAQPWVPLPADVPRFETQPDTTESFMAAVMGYRLQRDGSAGRRQGSDQADA